MSIRAKSDPRGAQEPDQIRLLRRVPPHKHGRLIRLAVNDHYVDVITDAGTTSLLMRFSDAIVEADGVRGLQVHRSHWVAFDHISSVRRAGGRLLLIMSDGLQVPVSKSRVAAFRAAQVLDRD